MSTASRFVRYSRWMMVSAALAVLAACGGDSDEQTCVDNPNRNPNLPSCGQSQSTTPPGAEAKSSISLTLADASGGAITTISPGAPGVLEAKVKDSNGNPAPSIAVTFTTTDKTGAFSPASGTALTDSNGVARITLLAGTAEGAYTVTATTPGTTTSTVITVGPDGSTLVIGTVQAGSASLGYAVTVPATPAIPVASIKFVGAEPTNIALRGTGGVGRQEFSTVTFQVFDRAGNPVQRAEVNFTLNTAVGGLSVLPQSAVTGADGKVSTVVSAGTIPTPIVMVTASLPGTGITTVSNVLVVSTGLAVDSRTSLSVSVGNFEGLDFDVCASGPVDTGTKVDPLKPPIVRISTGDHFGNPVPDGTAVGFTAEYGVVQASCLTGVVANAGNTGTTTPPGQTTNSQVSGIQGTCGVYYCSAGTRPPGGRSVVTAFLRGEEDFFDANGNNVCDGCANTLGAEFKAAYDLRPDVFRDDNENGRWDSNEPCIGPNANGSCSTRPDGMYNGVLANPKIPDASQTTYLARSYVAIWSGSTAVITTTPESGVCWEFSPPSGSPVALLRIRVVDRNGNPMPAGTRIEVTGPTASPVPTTFTVPNYILGIGQTFGDEPGQVPIEEYSVPISCAASSTGYVGITVTTPRGIVTTRLVSLR